MSAAVNNEDDDGVPLASYYLYDGINEVPSDVTHVRVAPSVTVLRSDVFGPPVHSLSPTDYSTRRANIQRVILPQGLRCIEKRAFSRCRSLTEIIIPPLVEEIGDEAFMHCSQLKEIALPNGLICINKRTFAYSAALRSPRRYPRSAKALFLHVVVWYLWIFVWNHRCAKFNPKPSMDAYL